MRLIRGLLSTASHHKISQADRRPGRKRRPAQNRPTLQLPFSPSYETGTIPAFNFAPESNLAQKPGAFEQGKIPCGREFSREYSRFGPFSVNRRQKRIGFQPLAEKFPARASREC